MNKKELENKYLGKTLIIIDMNGEPRYAGRKGVCSSVDDIGQLHGSWGGCALIPGEDSFEIMEG